MQDTPNLDKPFTLKSFVLRRYFKAVRFSDKLKHLQNGPSKIINKPTEVMYELLTQGGKTFNTYQNQLIP